MRYNPNKLEVLTSNMKGRSKEFIINFFVSSDGDIISNFENYLRDLESYGRSNKSIRKDFKKLYQAFFNISGMKVYYG